MTTLRNVVIVGGSYVGSATAKELASLLPATHRVLLVETHSHFHHLFAFPRFSIVPNHEHKAFIPYSGAPCTVVHAKVLGLEPSQVLLDREWEGSKKLPFDYLVAASGTRLAEPGTVPDKGKAANILYLRGWQQDIKNADTIAIIGGGAIGVQMATDLKEVYPDKDVTLIHSRDKLMPHFHEDLSNIVKARLKELNVKLVTGSRVPIPKGGFPRDGSKAQLKLADGSSISADLVIQATGQTPNTEYLSTLQASSPDSLINPANGFIRVRPTLQFEDPKYPNLFAVGDVADSGAPKAARPGAAQASVVAKNIVSMIEGKEPQENLVITPPGIHLTLGLTRSIKFKNPDTKAGETKPFHIIEEDGSEDMGAARIWARRGVNVRSEADYHL